MSIVLWDNIEYKGKKPLDSRMLFDTIADMKAYSENYLPDITLAFNKEDSKMYVFNRENEVDTTTGKWREFEGGDWGTESVYLTQAEFNALTPAEQDDPTKDYYITSNWPIEWIKIEDLDDVEITNPTVWDVLSYDTTTQKWINGKASEILTFKWSVDDYASLPSSDQEVWDVWNCLDNNKNYVWDGTAWDEFSSSYAFSNVDVLVNVLLILWQ